MTTTTTKTVSKVNVGDELAPLWKHQVIYRVEHDNGRVDIDDKGYFTAEQCQAKLDYFEAEIADWADTKAKIEELE